MKALQNRPLPQFARDMLACPPGRGAGLNNWFYRVARVLQAYRSAVDIVQLLSAATLGQPVKHREIERAVANSAAFAWQPGRRPHAFPPPSWPAVNAEQREAVLTSRFEIVDLWEASPRRLEANGSNAEQIIDQLFPGNPLLCVGQNNHQFTTRKREELRGQLDKTQFIVPSPMIARTGQTLEGKESEHCLGNTGPRRFLVVEQDNGTVDEQAAVLLHLAERAPLALAVHSGRKLFTGGSLRQINRKNVCVGLCAIQCLWARTAQRGRGANSCEHLMARAITASNKQFIFSIRR